MVNFKILLEILNLLFSFIFFESKERWILLLSEKLLDAETLRVLFVKLFFQIKDKITMTVTFDNLGTFEVY